MEEDVVGIKIIPPVVEFVDVEGGRLYETTIKIINGNTVQKMLRLQGPITKEFQLDVQNPKIAIAPGLGFTAKIKFLINKAEDCADRLVLLADSDVIEIPLYAYAPTALLDVQKCVDFGLVVANSHFLSKEMVLVNHGSKAGDYEIIYNGSKQIQISPQNGVLYPRKVMKVEVKLFTGTPGIVNETVDVHLDGAEEEVRVTIKAKIVSQALKILQYNDIGAEKKCINFGPVYYGTDAIEPALIYNEGPEPVKWVALLDEGCEGEEAGTDLTLTTAAILAQQCISATRGKAFDVLTSLVTVFPHQGYLEPYERAPIYFRFSPRFNAPRIGWESTEITPPRQDFALFMSFEIIGSMNSFTDRAGNGTNRRYEVGVTASALPVLLNITPHDTYNFGQLVCGEQETAVCRLQNQSAILPLNLKFKKIAQFNVYPKHACIKPGKDQEFVIVFQPNQPGNFRKIQLIEAFGQVFSDEVSDEGFKYETFQAIPIQLIGSAAMKPGIGYDRRNAESKKEAMRPKRNGALIACVDNRPTSIRPAEKGVKVETKFTKLPRHHYIDPDYALTKTEELKRIDEVNKYVNIIRKTYVKRYKKAETREHLKYDNSIDLGIKPAKGLRPHKLKAEDMEVQQGVEHGREAPISDSKRILNTRDLAEEEMDTRSHPITEGLNATPITKQEKLDCSKALTPKDLFNVVVGPPVIDFGEVCTRSTTRKQLSILNNLDHYISFEINIKFKELRQTSPLAQIIPPKSHAHLTLVFESTSEGQFDRSLRYTINSQHKSHLLVKASVVPVQLRLSTEVLEISPESGAPIDSAYRSTVTLYNDRNYPADFTWAPILGEKGTAFSIRPASGTVDAFKSLRCEVVFHQSYFAPLGGDFLLKVHEGASRKLSCIARLGPVAVKFQEKKMAFGNVALNLPTVRTAVIKNTGPNSAMFYVANSNPIPDMTILPIHGIIPVGGSSELKIMFEPKSLIKYDAYIEICIRGGKPLELRLNGTVDEPKVDMNIQKFNFHGVHCGSQHTIPFKMINKASTRVQMEVDMRKFEDFTFSYDKDQLVDANKCEQTSEISCFEIPAKESLNCSLTFHPRAVAGYDFFLPVVMNKTSAPYPAPSVTPISPTPPESSGKSSRRNSHIVTPKRRVVATGLRQPLSLSETSFVFSLPVSYMEMRVPDNAGGDRKTITMSNLYLEPVKWKLSLKSVQGLASKDVFVFLKQGGADFPYNKVSGVIPAGESYKLTIVFCPRKVGSYVCEIPLFINGDYTKPYRKIKLDAHMVQSKIRFEPPILSLNPVPLSTSVSDNFRIVATGFFKSTALKMKLVAQDSTEDDEDLRKYFQFDFPNGLQLNPSPTHTSEVTKTLLSAVITFSSHVMFSKSINVIFIDDMDRKFTMAVTATADNCLLSTYPFLALHRREYKIVCDSRSFMDTEAGGDGQQMVKTEEAILVPLHQSASQASRLSCAGSNGSSSRFCATSLSYDDTTPTNTAESNISEKLKKVYIVKPNTSWKIRGGREGSETSLSSLSNKEGGASLFTNDTFPESMGSGMSSATRKTSTTSSEDKKASYFTFNSEREEGSFKDLHGVGSAIFPHTKRLDRSYHMEVVNTIELWYSSFGWSAPFSFKVPETIRNLVSRYVYRPSEDVAKSSNAVNSKTLYDMINFMSGKPLPGVQVNQPLPTNTRERVTQLHWQHHTLITFVKSQGGAVSGIRAEYLLSPADYRSWVRMKGLDRIEPSPRRIHETDEQSQSESSSGESEEEDMPLKEECSRIILHADIFELISKRAWTDLLLQIYKVLILSRITHDQYRSMKPPIRGTSFPLINPVTTASNLYSTSERIVLSWLNYNFEHVRKTMWNEETAPPSRWVVNFDLDLLDGLVLAAALAAYCPWLKEEFFGSIYTSPRTPEQCLHNTLLVIRAMKSIGLSYHIQATDITDPNPITMLFLCVHLYQNLPGYLPKAKIDFVGGLSSAARRKVIVQNPGGSPMKYICKLCGRDSSDFTVASGRDVHVVPRGANNVEVIFKSRLLRPAEAYLVLVSKYEFPLGVKSERKYDMAIGSTLVFELNTIVTDIEPVKIINCASPCYELTEVPVVVINPFNKAGKFKVILTEPKIDAPTKKCVKNKKKPESRLDSLLSPDLQDRLRTFSLDDGRPQNEIFSFYCKTPSIWLEANGKEIITVDYLPFNMGKDFCTILLVNEQIGEVVYAVEGEAKWPLPSPLYLNKNSPHSAVMDEQTKKMRDWKENILYWKCPMHANLYETLLLPVTNPSKERALRVAARQRMSETERQRRTLTGTLESGSVAAEIAIQGRTGYDPIYSPFKSLYTKMPAVAYKVKCSSKWYTAPLKVVAPASPVACGSPTPATEMEENNCGPNSIQPDGTFGLDLKFRNEAAGLYPCDIFVSSENDVRVYRIECVVHPTGSKANFDFNTPANQSLTQNIPIQNGTNHDWFLTCRVQGECFEGPRCIAVKAQETAQYPLTFSPNRECVVEGRLTISNKADGLEHNLTLHGVGETSLALEHVNLRCKCRQEVTKTIKVPNFSEGSLTYAVYSDLPFLDGPNSLVVPKNKTMDYNFTMSPQQRGTMKGVIMFVADDVDPDPVDGRESCDSDESLDDEMSKTEEESIRPETPSFAKRNGTAADRKEGQKVWFAIKVEVEPSDPVQVVQLECAAQQLITKDITVTNPTSHEITLDVNIIGESLSTQKSLRLMPNIPGILPIVFNPTRVGLVEGAVVFDNPATGEFWYKVVANAKTPEPISLPTMVSALGSHTRQKITLKNMTKEVMEVEIRVDNRKNYSFDLPMCDSGCQETEVKPNSSINLLLQFAPTMLGLHKHKAQIIFRTQQLGDIIYYVTGRGLAPSLMEPMSISASMGSQTSLALPFRNPTDLPVLVDLKLTEDDEILKSMSNSVLRKNVKSDPGFHFLGKELTNVLVAPHTLLDIPFSFIPNAMKKHLATISVSVRRQDGKFWPAEFEECEKHLKPQHKEAEDLALLKPMSRDSKGNITSIRWLYPIHGIPTLKIETDAEAVLTCQARSRIEERLEVSLTGAAPHQAESRSKIRLRGASPHSSQSNFRNKSPDSIDGYALNEEFHFEFFYCNEASKNEIEKALSVELIRKDRDPCSGIVVLIFKIIFSPYFTMDAVAQLHVTSVSGGSWDFPLRIKATEPPPDDCIKIEANMVGKPSVVAFTLHSQCGYPTPFEAYFSKKSDPEFDVFPRGGELQPDGSDGTKFEITFTPSKYGRKFFGLLIIKAIDMQWSYELVGTFPKYQPPQAQPRIDIGPPMAQKRPKSKRTNFLQENLKLLSTSASSPVKGKRIIGGF